VLRAAAAARPTATRFQSIHREVHRSGLGCPRGRAVGCLRPERQPRAPPRRGARGCAECTAARRRRGYAAAASATQGESIVMPVVMLKRASPVQSCKPYIRFAIAPRINQGEANSLIG